MVSAALPRRMGIWIGHFAGTPDDWFLAWGESESDAITFARARLCAALELASVLPLRGAGGMWFRAARHMSPFGEGDLSFYRPPGTHGRLPLMLGDEDALAHVAGSLSGAPTRARPPPGAGRAPLQDEFLVRVVGRRSNPAEDWFCACLARDDADDLPCERFRRSRRSHDRCSECGHVGRCHVVRP